LSDSSSVLDDAAIGRAFHIIDIAFIEGPGVDQPFGTVCVIDRSAIEAVGFRLPVGFAGGKPRRSCGCQRFIGRVFEKSGDGSLHGCGGAVRILVAGEDDIGVGDDGFRLERFERGLRVGRNGDAEAKQDDQPEQTGHSVTLS
jgi:hypothetical protein